MVTSSTGHGPLPPRGDLTRLVVSKRHVLTVQTVNEGSSKHREQSMILIDRETHEDWAFSDLPKFLSFELGNRDRKYSIFPHSLFFTCDLSWSTVL